MYKIYFFQSRLSKGLTLLEVIITIFLVSVGIVGIYSLITQTLSSSTTVSQKLIAGYLAQEGIEIVRNIRDTNWLEGAASWDDGIATIPDYRLDYQSLEFPDTTCNLAGNYLRYDDGNFYNCSSGTETKFIRKITIDVPSVCPSNECISVQVKVSWPPDHSITAQENLYNWYQ